MEVKPKASKIYQKQKGRGDVYRGCILWKPAPIAEGFLRCGGQASAYPASTCTGRKILLTKLYVLHYICTSRGELRESRAHETCSMSEWIRGERRPESRVEVSLNSHAVCSFPSPSCFKTSSASDWIEGVC